MEPTFTQDPVVVVDRTPVLTARFNRYGQLIEIEDQEGRRVSSPTQSFHDAPLPDIDLKKLQTFNVLVWDDANGEEHICVHWFCRLYCFPGRHDVHQKM
ncbi:MAG: hypothetical protein ACRD15_05245 [Vicinamibacterales bacterium]